MFYLRFAKMLNFAIIIKVITTTCTAVASCHTDLFTDHNYVKYNTFSKVLKIVLLLCSGYFKS